MFVPSFLKTHRAWEDWVMLALGSLVVVSPVVDPLSASPGALINTAVVGFLLICLAMTELAYIGRWEEWASFAIGGWLMASPALLGYGGALQVSHVLLGALVVACAALELWQDRGATQR